MRHESSEALRRLLTDDEELLWHGRPRWRSLVVQFLVYGIPVTVFLGPFVFFGLFVVVFAIAAASDSLALLLGGLVVSAVGAIVIVVGLIYLAARRAYGNAEYAATDDRLIAFGGVIGRDLSSVSWDDVQDVEVAVGWLDTRYGTGSIEAVTAGRAGSGVTFSFVESPYEVLERLDRRSGEAPG